MENTEPATEPKITKVKKYTIEITFFDNDTCRISRTCDGFNAFELLGICAHASYDIMDQVGGRVRPTEVKRNLIVD